MLNMTSGNKFTESIKRIKGLVKNAVSENLENIDKDELEAYQSMNQVLDAMNDVIVEQEEALKTISKQLDDLNAQLLERGRV